MTDTQNAGDKSPSRWCRCAKPRRSHVVTLCCAECKEMIEPPAKREEKDSSGIDTGALISEMRSWSENEDGEFSLSEAELVAVLTMIDRPATLPLGHPALDVLAKFNRHFFTDGKQRGYIGVNEWRALALALMPPPAITITGERK